MTSVNFSLIVVSHFIIRAIQSLWSHACEGRRKQITVKSWKRLWRRDKERKKRDRNGEKWRNKKGPIRDPPLFIHGSNILRMHSFNFWAVVEALLGPCGEVAQVRKRSSTDLWQVYDRSADRPLAHARTHAPTHKSAITWAIQFSTGWVIGVWPSHVMTQKTSIVRRETLWVRKY